MSVSWPIPCPKTSLPHSRLHSGPADTCLLILLVCPQARLSLWGFLSFYQAHGEALPPCVPCTHLFHSNHHFYSVFAYLSGHSEGQCSFIFISPEPKHIKFLLNEWLWTRASGEIVDALPSKPETHFGTPGSTAYLCSVTKTPVSLNSGIT